MKLSDLQREAHAIAQDQGWYDTEPTFEDSIASIHGALNEVLEEYRSCGMAHNGNSYEGEPFGIAAELADVVIHLAAMAEHEHVGLVSINPRWTEAYLNPKASFGEWIAFGHLLLADCHLLAQHGHPLIEDVSAETWEEAMCNFIGFIRKMAAHHDIDLDAAIAAKMGYYRTRSYRHGGKAL